MDHDQSRSHFGETAGRDHVDDAFLYHSPPDDTGVPHVISHMGQHAYAPVLHLFEADHGLGVDMPAHLPFQYPSLYPALDALQLDPQQAWAEVYETYINLPPRNSNGNSVSYEQFSNQNHLAAPPPNYATLSSTATPSQSTRSLFDVSHLGPHPTPSFPLDSLSNYSGDTSTSSDREKCDACGQSVGSGLMRRHRQDVHRQRDDPAYMCKCGHADPAMRRDNHKRHLKTCKRTNGSQLVFTCWCGNTLGDKQEHLDHIQGCRSRRLARTAS